MMFPLEEGGRVFGRAQAFHGLGDAVPFGALELGFDFGEGVDEAFALAFCVRLDYCFFERGAM